MTLPFSLPFALPDWLPPWVFLLLALPILLWLLAFLLMPFSVFGVKSRLESLEAQVDALQEELRNNALRRTRAGDYEDIPDFGRLKAGQIAGLQPPPPAPLTPLPRREDPVAGRRAASGPARRMEPKLD